MDTFTHMTAEGAELRFAHLSLYDIFGDPKNPEPNGFVPQYHSRNKRRIVENLKLAGFDRDGIAIELQGYDRDAKKKPGREHFVDYLDEDTARNDVMEFSWRKANPEKDRPVLTMVDVEAIRETLLNPIGITFQSPADEPAADPDSPAPTDTSTYGDGGTDSPNPTAPPLTYSATPMETAGGATSTTSGTGSSSAA